MTQRVAWFGSSGPASFQAGPDLIQVGLSPPRLGLSRFRWACLDLDGGPDLVQVGLSTLKWACLISSGPVSTRAGLLLLIGWA